MNSKYIYSYTNSTQLQIFPQIFHTAQGKAHTTANIPYNSTQIPCFTHIANVPNNLTHTKFHKFPHKLNAISTQDHILTKIKEIKIERLKFKMPIITN